MQLVEIFKVLLFGIVEGVTEWLPISSTGHMLLLQNFITLDVSQSFWEMFLVVIQLGAILAVVVSFFNKMCAFLKKDILQLWCKVLVALLPAIIIGLPFDDIIEALFYTPLMVALMLIVYGIVFILVEHTCRKKDFTITSLSQMNYKTALFIGIFQVLALIPGTSRSGATIIGAMLLGTTRSVAAEFTFYLAVPVMLGASLLKLVKFGFVFSSAEIATLLIGMLSAFIVSLLVIRFLMRYVQKHDFRLFGYYRILLGIIILLIL